MWHFRKKPRGEKIRDPIQGAFFSTEAVAGPAQALVRESVQNSLDARTREGPVRMRFFVSGETGALPPDRTAEFFDGAWEHYAADGSGLHNPPAADSSCAYLVVEDFGTRGLTGDPAQADPESGVENPFFLFFRAEGVSSKTGSELGRWGVGKFVFPRSSLASTHFGLTVRQDDGQRLLIGAITLKAHRIGTETFTPDAVFGRADDDGFVLPFDDSVMLQEFSDLFSIARSREPGLSVVIPFLDPEITFEAILVATVRNWFMPLLAGDLEVRVESPGRQALLNSASLELALEEHATALGAPVLEYVRLARWGRSLPDSERLQLLPPDPARAAKWSPELVPDEIASRIRDQLEARKSVAVRVPLTVRPKGRNAQATFFDLLLCPDRNAEGRPLFVREGILVSDVKGGRVAEIRALVCVDDLPMATLLGDSEGPAHTEWQKDGTNFQHRYTYGRSVIDFVTRSVAELLAIISRRAADADPSLTVDFFSIEPPEEDLGDGIEADESKRRKPAPGDMSEIEHPDPDGRPRRILVSRIEGGFGVSAGPGAPEPPYLIELRCAYNIRSGNALRKWNSADFDLSDAAIVRSVDRAGAAIQSAKGNWMLLRIDENSFRVSVAGFDGARDLLVKYEVRERDAGQEV